MMKVFNFKSSQEASLACATSILQTVNTNENAMICYATGNSVTDLYSAVIDGSKQNEITFTKTKAFQLDEYYNNLEDDGLYMRHIIANTFNKLDIPIENQIFFKITLNEANDLNFYQEQFNSPLDLMILGVGKNGHLAYNEPGSDKDINFQIVDLELQSTKSTLNYGFKENDELPTRGITIGLKTIFESKKIVLIALGDTKIEVMKEFKNSNAYNPLLPISILHNHPNLEIYTDFVF